MKGLRHAITFALITVAIAFAAPKATNVTAADQTARIGMPGGSNAGDSNGGNNTDRIGMPGGS